MSTALRSPSSSLKTSSHDLSNILVDLGKQPGLGDCPVSVRNYIGKNSAVPQEGREEAGQEGVVRQEPNSLYLGRQLPKHRGSEWSESQEYCSGSS